jgi:hypothetical protein
MPMRRKQGKHEIWTRYALKSGLSLSWTTRTLLAIHVQMTIGQEKGGEERKLVHPQTTKPFTMA